MRIIKLAIAVGAVCGSVFAQVPQIATGGVIDAAGFTKGQAIAPGSLVSIFGSGLSSALAAGDTVPLSISLNGTSVSFNGVLAGLDFVSGGQINAQVPWNVVSSGTLNVVVTTSKGASPAMAVPVAQFSPGIFSIPPGAGYAVAINADGSIAAPAGAIGISVTEDRGIDDLLSRLDALVRDRYAAPEGSLVNERQHQAVTECADALRASLASIESRQDEQFVLVDLYRASTALGLLTGAITRDEVFDEIFSKFCIGK